MTAPAISLQNLGKSFGKIQAVDGVSLEINPGEMVGFLGPNGAGKSTTLYMITGLVHPSTGHIEIFGHDTRREFKRAMNHVGAMVEAPAFYEYLSAQKNLEIIGRLRGIQSREQVDEILHQVRLFNRRKDKVRTYSQGMKQRLGLASTLLGNPKLLLLDEPTNGLDPEATREMMELLQNKAQSEGIAVFLSSHLLNEVEEYCDRVFVVNHGRLIASGKVDEILKPYAHIVRVGFRGACPSRESILAYGEIEAVETVSEDLLEITMSSADAVWLNRLLLENGYEVSSLVPRKKTLREFFLEVTGEQTNGADADTSSAQ